MTRTVKVAAAQVGAINIDTPREEVIARLLNLLDQASQQKVRLVVFPELTLTTFFPRHILSPTELNAFFESEPDIIAASSTAPLFEKAVEYGIDIVVGYAELSDAVEGDQGEEKTQRGFNTCIYYSASEKRVLSKYRKTHLPGTLAPFSDPEASQQLEKRYFHPGDLGFNAFRAPGLVADVLKQPSSSASEREKVPAGPLSHLADQGKGDPILGMLICNDRRWPESWRCLGLQGAELVLCGYNTGSSLPHLRGTTSTSPRTPEEAKAQALFHSRLVQQSGSYQNACFSICAARCGNDDGRYGLIAGSAIVGPDGNVVAEASTEGDELVSADLELSDARVGKEKTFCFERHRRVEHYGVICERTGVVEPALLD